MTATPAAHAARRAAINRRKWGWWPVVIHVGEHAAWRHFALALLFEERREARA